VKGVNAWATGAQHAEPVQERRTDLKVGHYKCEDRDVDWPRGFDARYGTVLATSCQFFVSEKISPLPLTKAPWA
jgi:hypothetical protein